MRIVIAPDSFKESMSSEKAGQAIACGIQAVLPDAECHVVPMSDGGEGFTDAIAHALNASLLNIPVTDAVGRKSLGQLAVSIPSSSSEGVPTAVIEVASAVGLDGVAPADRNPMKATSRGVGELIERAMDEVGPSGRIIVGLGGSATNDAGAGMLAQLGARFVTRDGNAVDPLPERFHEIAAVDLTGLDERIRSVRFEIASDVSNPLLGDNGASAVFGPQKGADPAMVKELDLRLATLLDAFEANGGIEGARTNAGREGAGAAGGLGWAFATFFNAHFEPGIDVVSRVTGLADVISGRGTGGNPADLVITGEGAIDAQTLNGKAPAGVAAVARNEGVPCVVLAGRVSSDADVLYDAGVTALVPIVQGASSLEDALRDGEKNIERTARTVMRLVTTRV